MVVHEFDALDSREVDLRRNDIQGLRAIAVVIVLLFHAFPSVFPGGYIGVDVFFVISGYLITGIVYREAVAGNFSYADFYRRRIRRIFPALFVMIFVTTVVGAVILSPAELVSLAKSAISTVFSLSNVFFWLTSGYFATEADLQPLLHTWSLGVEEQFYVLLPITIVLFYRFVRRLLLPLLVIAFLLSLALSEWAIGRSVSASYFLLPTRSFELLAGSILAVSKWRMGDRDVRLRNVLIVVGIMLILTPTFAFTEKTAFPGLNALYPTIGSALILLGGTSDTTVTASRVISTPVFRFFGDISYSLYLWHWPILAFLRVRFGEDLPVSMAFAAVLAAVALAALSYRFVEQPMLRIGAPRMPVLTLGASAMVVGALMLAPIVSYEGFPNRFSNDSLALFDAAKDYNPRRSACHRDNGAPFPYSSNCIFGELPDNDHLIAVWGDSHGAELAFVLGREASKLGMNVMEITASSCPPALDYAPSQRPYCVGHNRQTLDHVIADSRVKTVILAANGIGYNLNRQAFEAGYEKVVDALRTAGKDVVLVDQIPTFDADPPRALGYAEARDEDIRRLGEPVGSYEHSTSAWNSLVHRIAAERGLGLVPVRSILCPDDFCAMYDTSEGVLYFNRNHVSLAGARRLARSVVANLRPAVRAN